jgi:selenocysteine-specific elongation factor
MGLRAGGSARLFNAALRRLVSQGALAEAGPLVYRPDHQIQFTVQQQQNINRMLARFAASPYSPPTLKECQAELGEDVTTALIETGQLVGVPPDLVFRSEDYARMVSAVRQMIQQQGSLTVAQARDYFNTSRRYVLAFLEHLDASGVTVRSGDERKLAEKVSVKK